MPFWKYSNLSYKVLAFKVYNVEIYKYEFESIVQLKVDKAEEVLNYGLAVLWKFGSKCSDNNSNAAGKADNLPNKHPYVVLNFQKLFVFVSVSLLLF